MEQEKKTESPQEDSRNAIQRFMDNPWILLLLGLLVPIVSYTIWGIIELFTIGKAQLP